MSRQPSPLMSSTRVIGWVTDSRPVAVCSTYPPLAWPRNTCWPADAVPYGPRLFDDCEIPTILSGMPSLLRSRNGAAAEAFGSVIRSAVKFVVVGQWLMLGSPL